MAVLSSNQVLLDNKTTDPDSITSLSLTHKALSDVSCLSQFKNLQRLDLSFNNLTSLEGLKLCVNLKWLSVVENKLQSLQGVEGLIKLTVLNAGKNKLKCMDEVSGLVNLRALILNDNNIVSICKLDKLKELNTLVLSRNPLSGIGQSLAKINSITKLSLSYCQLLGIDTSLKYCIELKELRLAHNDIKTLPSELAFNMKLQNLDIGNNVIMKWSDVKVLSSLVNLKNLNLQGNPIAEKEKTLAKKIKKQVPNLQILNGIPIEKALKKEEGGRRVDGENESGHVDIAGVLASNEERKLKKNQASGPQEEGVDSSHHKESSVPEYDKVKKSNKFSKNDVSDGAETVLRARTESKLKKEKIIEFTEDKASRHKRKEMVQVRGEKSISEDVEVPPIGSNGTRDEQKRKKQKSQVLKEKASNHKNAVVVPDKSSSKQNKANAIDDGETPFADLFVHDSSQDPLSSRKDINHRTLQNVDAAAGLVTYPKKKKQHKATGAAALHLSSSVSDEVGLGGESTWG